MEVLLVKFIVKFFYGFIFKFYNFKFVNYVSGGLVWYSNVLFDSFLCIVFGIRGLCY